MASDAGGIHRHNDITTYRSPDPNPIAVQLRDEVSQTARIRQAIMREIEDKIERRVVTLYTSFYYPVIIDDSDAAILDGILQAMDLSSGLTLILSSPGGSGVSAERIIRCLPCVLKQQLRGDSSWDGKVGCDDDLPWRSIDYDERYVRMGPIDPQVFVASDGNENYVPANLVIESYEALLKEAIESQGRIEPYLQLLSRYDPSEIRQFKEAQALGDDIAKRALQTGMLKNQGNKIGGVIRAFSDPKRTRTHERPIFWKEAHDVGLTVNHIDNRDALWLLVSDLHQRADFVVSGPYTKIIETCDQEFGVPAR